MKIRLKFILVVLPIIIVSLIFAEGIAWVGVTRGVNKMAEDALDFKLYQLENYADNQWSLLVENGYADNKDMVDAAKKAVETYAKTITIKQSECIFALDEKSGALVMETSTLGASPEEIAALLAKTRERGEEDEGELLDETLGAGKRVLKTVSFVPFNWQIFVSDERDAFYSVADGITKQALITLIAASAIAVALLVVFSHFLTAPLSQIVNTMLEIVSTSSLSRRTKIVFDDEIGTLAQTFNYMLDELERSYNQTKKYAFESTLAQKKEMRLREIFQKYVPQNVIEQFFASPESMLKGDDRDLAILFSDIRGFTTISETMQPDEVVDCLNRYFSGQVDSVLKHNGIVDKYIGDALMAFWGAPVKSENDALAAVLSALDMLDALAIFNKEQAQLGKLEFRIGIGINYGKVTVGNIGNERKMDYTIIGDAVNLASRVEDLTKNYKKPLLITEYVWEKVKDHVHCELVDSVVVRGRSDAVKIYSVSRSGEALAAL